MDTLAVAARKQLVELGLLEDSGQRRRSPTGEMQVVWRLSARGLLVDEYRTRFRLSWEDALKAVPQRYS
jgi:hypothetical protein